MKTKNEPKQTRRHVGTSARRTRKRRNDPPRQGETLPPQSEPQVNGYDVLPAPDAISYGQAVIKGKQLVAKLKSQDEAVEFTEFELGELANGLETKYRGKTLADFAEKIGVEADRLNRCRSVYRAYKNEDFKGASPKFAFAVAQALQAHPRRIEILKKFPKLTVRGARTMMREYRLGQGKPEPAQEAEQAQRQELAQGQEEPEQEQAQAPAPAPEQESDWRVRDAQPWFANALKDAAEAATNYGNVRPEYLDPDVLRKAIPNLDQLLDALGKGGDAMFGLRDKVRRALGLADPTLH